MSKKSENGSEPRTEQDGMNEYVETADEVKDNEVGKHKPENRGTELETRKLQRIRCTLVALRLSSRYVFFGVDNNKSAASCAQASCKLIVKNLYPQA